MAEQHEGSRGERSSMRAIHSRAVAPKTYLTDRGIDHAILVVGAGAVGGFLGGRLVQAGKDVTFLVRDKRAADLQGHGLQIIGPHISTTSRPKAIAVSQIAGPFDVVLLSVKGNALSAAMDDLAPAVGTDTSIIPVLNGMRHVDLWIERFGRHSVLGGACWLPQN